jgi:hypothetical protein
MRLNVAQVPAGEMLAAYLPGCFSLSEGPAVEAAAGDVPGYAATARDDGSVAIAFAGMADLMIALGDLLAEGPPTPTREHVPALGFRAVMLDCSRNGVPTEAFLKGAILRLAMMGMNAFCLYTEDTYEVDGEPLVGYGRGAYTKAELRELATFAGEIGVTMFPCIQTLGHLEQILKYEHYQHLQDTDRVLREGSPEVEGFLDQLIANAAEPYDTPYIHVGMDETWGIGRGKAFREDAPVNPLAMYARHVAKVAEICRRRGLQPIMWGDFILGHSGERPMGEEELALLPKDMIMNYWQYHHQETDPHLKAIAAFRAMDYEPVVSPGLHNWGRFWPDLRMAIDTVTPCLQAVHQAKLDMAMLTMWGDDGQECLFDLNYPALAHYLAWCREADPADGLWQRRCDAISGFPCAALAAISRLERAEIDDARPKEAYVSAKMLFYDDPLTAHVERMFRDDTPARAFGALADELAAMMPQAEAAGDLLRLAERFARIVAAKFALGRNCRQAYADNAPDALQEAIAAVPALAADLAEFHTLYKRLWRRERKPFGLEVMDVRIAGLRARIETLRETVQDYLDGEADAIPEFELPTMPDLRHGDLNTWRKLATRCLSLW